MTAHKVARWRSRFLDLGLAGLEKDAPRPGRTPSVSAAKIKQVVNMTTQEKPVHATHWSTRTMAAAVGLSPATVRRIWHGHGLKPHLVETFKVSNDPLFAQKLEAVVGLYLNPPEHALVLCCDEKSQNPGPGSDPTGFTSEEGAGRNHDSRLQTQWDRDAICSSQCTRWQGHQHLPGPPPSPGMDQVPAAH